MDYKRIIYKPGRVAQIIMNRPERRNGISNPMYMELNDAFERAAADPECRVIIHSGAGPCFSAGHSWVKSDPENRPVMADGRPAEELIKQYGSLEVAMGEFNRELWALVSNRFKKWRYIPKPTIAMVHGYCVGAAWGNACAMDLLFCSEDALFMLGAQGTTIEGWEFNTRKFLEAAYENRFITGREAYEWGIANRVYPNREILEKETIAFANRIADDERPTHCRLLKESVLRTRDIQGFATAGEASEMWHQKMMGLTPQEEKIASSGKGRHGLVDTAGMLAKTRLKEEEEQKYYKNWSHRFQ